MTTALAALSFGTDGWGDELAAGALVTVELALATLPVGLAIGLSAALMRNARSRVLRTLGEVYGAVFRGLPELLTLFIVYYGAPLAYARVVALGESALGLPPSEAGLAIGAFEAGVAALALVLGAFSSEVFLGAIRAVPAGQREAAAALGMSPAQSFRLVELPQVWRFALPGLSNSWMTLLKDTSLVSVIALPDLMREANIAAGATRDPFLFYLAACMIYLAMSALSSGVAARLEWSASRGLPEAGR